MHTKEGKYFFFLCCEMLYDRGRVINLIGVKNTLVVFWCKNSLITLNTAHLVYINSINSAFITWQVIK